MVIKKIQVSVNNGQHLALWKPQEGDVEMD